MLITRRTTQRSFLLTPCKETIQAWLYCLGLAAQDYGVELHGTCVESNHHHTQATDHLANLPLFTRDLHALVAKVMNAHWRREEGMWASSVQTSVVVCATPEDAFEKLIYTVTNPAKDHLVRRARDWPGVTSIKPEYRCKEITVRRPHWFFDGKGDMPKTVTLRFTRPPGHDHLTEEEWVEKVDAAVEAVEDNAQRERDKTGSRVVGCDTIKNRQSHLDTPERPATKKRHKINPTVACKNKQLRADILHGQKQWRHDYRAALEAYRDGNKSALFPLGTYQLRVDTHVQVDDGPGPLLPPYATRLRAA